VRAATGHAWACALTAAAVASCGTSSVGVCTRDTDCASGDLCNLQGECVAPAPPPEVDAGTPPPPPDAPGTMCTEQALSLGPTPPAVQLVIDLSGTMNNGFDGSTRYRAVRDALTDGDGVIATLDDQVLFGVTLYTSHNGGATCPILQSVKRRLGNGDAIETVLQDNNPDADNPLAETLARVESDFATDVPPADAARVVIVATDGVADSCDDSDDGSGADASIAAAQSLFATGIELHMISIANGVEANYLQKMANAGAGQDPTGTAEAPFQIARDREALRDAFASLVRDARCRISTAAIPAGRLGATRLSVAGRTLTEGVDWTADGADRIALIGAACDDFLGDPAPTVSAVVPCE
jgi:hypothetical protein